MEPSSTDTETTSQIMVYLGVENCLAVRRRYRARFIPRAGGQLDFSPEDVSAIQDGGECSVGRRDRDQQMPAIRHPGEIRSSRSGRSLGRAGDFLASRVGQ